MSSWVDCGHAPFGAIEPDEDPMMSHVKPLATDAVCCDLSRCLTDGAAAASMHAGVCSECMMHEFAELNCLKMLDKSHANHMPAEIQHT